MKRNVNVSELKPYDKISFFYHLCNGFWVLNGTVSKVTDKTIEINGKKKYIKTKIHSVNLFD